MELQRAQQMMEVIFRDAGSVVCSLTIVSVCVVLRRSTPCATTPAEVPADAVVGSISRHQNSNTGPAAGTTSASAQTPATPVGLVLRPEPEHNDEQQHEHVRCLLRENPFW